MDLSTLFSTTVIALIITAIMVILTCYSIKKSQIYSKALIGALGICTLLMIWTGVIPSSMILLTLLSIAVNLYMIVKER
jgi:hypothetical protein